MESNKSLLLVKPHIALLRDKLINDFFYNVSALSENFFIEDICIDLAVFKENQPHVIDNLFLICDVTSNNIDRCHEKFKLVGEVIKRNIYLLFFKNNSFFFYKYLAESKKIINYPTTPVFSFGDFCLFKKDLILPKDLLGLIETIHNHIYANEGYSTAEVFNELIKILMVKFVDEQKSSEEKLDFYLSEAEAVDLHGPEGYRFTQRINFLYEEVASKYPALFKFNEGIKLTPSVLAFTIAQLQRYNLFDMDSDIKGLIFQKVITSGQKGERGQFFTPDPIISLMVNFLKPQFNETVLDPACGTGGFLRQVISFVRSNNKEKDIQYYIKNCVFGTEINPTIARVANLRFIFEGSDAMNVDCCNALSDLKTGSVSKILTRDAYDLILTNPPFGSQGKITDKKTLSSFNLGYKWCGKKPQTLQNGQTPDILFIERCIDLLKPNGRMGIVLPDGDLENPSLEYVRTYILSKCDLIGVIKLPDQAFVPFGTGVKASVLFLKKKENPDINNASFVFFAKINNLGYIYNKNASVLYRKDPFGNPLLDSIGNPIVNEDCTKINKQYELYLQTNKIQDSDDCFVVESKDIKGRFDFEYYSPKYMKNVHYLINRRSIPLHSIAKIIRGKAPLLKQKNKIVKYIEISDLNPSTSEIISYSEIPVHELPSRATFEVRTGDVITSVAGNSIGTSKHASALVTSEYDKSICTNGFKVIRPFAVDPYYLIYYFKTDFFLNQILRLRTGAAIPSVSDDDFNNILVLIPEEEQLKQITIKIQKSFELRAQAKALFAESLSEIYS